MRDGQLGNIDISRKTIQRLISRQLRQMPEVAGMASKNRMDGVSRLLSWESPLGFKIAVAEEALMIDLHLILHYGEPIRPAAERIQYAIRQQLETMLQVRVKAVNIYVQGLQEQHHS